MVDKSDYKMISIFEVFAINRNEDDFLENIQLFATIVQEDQAKKKEEEEEASNPDLVSLNDLLKEGVINEE